LSPPDTLHSKARRIGTVLAANHFDAESFGPNAKLLDRRGTKGVGCRQQDVMSILLQIMREFAVEVVFPVPFTRQSNQCRFAIRSTDRRESLGKIRAISSRTALITSPIQAQTRPHVLEVF